jgi:hypothetical protein
MTVAAGQAAPASQSQCFMAHQFQTWKASDDRTILIRVDPHRYYRLDLAVPCAGIRSPGIFLVTTFRGPNLVCNALDWNITLKDNIRGPTQGCIVQKMTELTPEEVAVIPAKSKP